MVRIQLARVMVTVDRIGADEGPSRRSEAVGEPQRNTAGEHHIHGQREAVSLARADDHYSLR